MKVTTLTFVGFVADGSYHSSSNFRRLTSVGQVSVFIVVNGEFLYGATPQVLSTMVRQRLPCLGMRWRWLPDDQRKK
jgi:hypothetical protein